MKTRSFTKHLSLSDDIVLCSNCNGSGEGMHDGTTCYVCRGSGEVSMNDDHDDESYDESWEES